MAEALISARTVMRRLSPSQTAETLSKAVATRAPILLQLVPPAGLPDGERATTPTELFGVVTHEEGSLLLIECGAPASRPPDSARESNSYVAPKADRSGARKLVSGVGTTADRIDVEAAVTIRDTAYAFRTHLVGRRANAKDGLLRIVKPASIYLRDRRRSARRQLRAAVRVELCLAAEPQEASRCDAVMLNLSVDGMACRIASRDATDLSVGQTVRAVFQLREDDPPFALGARVTNLTAGGSSDRMVVGLEFSTDALGDASRSRLSTLLETI